MVYLQIFEINYIIYNRLVTTSQIICSIFPLLLSSTETTVLLQFKPYLLLNSIYDSCKKYCRNCQMKARIISDLLIKVILRFDLKNVGKVEIQKMIPKLFYGSFQKFFLECDNINRANIYLSMDHWLWMVHSFEKFQNAIFSRYQKFFSWGNSNRSRAAPKFFSKYFFYKYGR